MKLEPIAKPVRIRISSNGKDHADLVSLRENFRIDDVFKAYKERRLTKWLCQINQNDLAQKVEGIKESSDIEIKKMLCLLMLNPSKNIDDICLQRIIKDDEQFIAFLIDANDLEDSRFFIHLFDIPVLEFFSNSNNEKISGLAKQELGMVYYKMGEKNSSVEMQRSYFLHAAEYGNDEAIHAYCLIKGYSAHVGDNLHNAIEIEAFDDLVEAYQNKKPIIPNNYSCRFVNESAVFINDIYETIKNVKGCDINKAFSILRPLKFKEARIGDYIDVAHVALSFYCERNLAYSSESLSMRTKRIMPDSFCKKHYFFANLIPRPFLQDKLGYACELLSDVVNYFIFENGLDNGGNQ